MKKNNFVMMSVGLIIISFFISSFVSINTLRKVMRDNEEAYVKVLAGNIYDTINRSLETPILIGQTMAQDSFMIQFMSEEQSHTEKDVNQTMENYLASFVDELPINSAYVVSDATRRYYTDQGFNKIIQPETDTYDSWYTAFIEQDIPYDFDINVDEIDRSIWTVFVDHRVEDTEGKLLGVCGVGVILDELQKEIAGVQDKYGVHIKLVNENGLNVINRDEDTQADSNLVNLSFQDKETEYSYQTVGKGYIVTKYMEYLNLYLVIESDSHPLNASYAKMLSDIFAKLIAILTVVILIVIIIMVRGNQSVALMARVSGMSSLANIYVSMHLIDIGADTIQEIKSNDAINGLIDKKTQTATEQLKSVMSGLADETFTEEIVAFVDLSTLSERMKGMRTISHEFVGKYNGWCRARFIAEDTDLDHINHVIYAVEVIDKEKRREKELIELSEKDQLTSILNRGSGEKKISDYLLQKQSGMMLLLDADDFKSVNDNFGHDVGDKVIIAIANALKEAYRDEDIVMRLGGDEFSAYVVGISDETAGTEAIERLIDHINHIDIPELKERKITISIGASLYNGEERISFEEIYKQVDTMLYVSKKTKGNCFHFFHENN